ncbi:MAG: MHYT domain-containing protein [Pseudomonadota bacterium]
MEFLATSHNTVLVLASFVVALAAGFTGLTLTKDLARQTVAQRKLAVSLGAIALGGGIWSMHFVAMLGLELPILFYYDAALTLASALVAILLVGCALIVLHFFPRRKETIALAGSIVGIGILAMHYLGMAGLQLCRAVYTLPGLAIAVVSAIGLSIAAFWVAYGLGKSRRVVLGTCCFGAAVFAVHFVAMFGTRFVAVPGLNQFGPVISNQSLAIAVILSSFLIFGAFLWAGVTYLVPAPAVSSEPANIEVEPEESAVPVQADPVPTRIPCEKDGRKVFIAPVDVAFIRADGHYTQVYTTDGRLFCVWPITEATKRLEPKGFVKVHRSYLINPDQVASFERSKDNGKCTFRVDSLPDVPVSRSNLKSVQTVLGA